MDTEYSISKYKSTFTLLHLSSVKATMENLLMMPVYAHILTQPLMSL